MKKISADTLIFPHKKQFSAMKYICDDREFTSETERDFATKRLPTLSFECWSEKTGVRHSYYENEMRSQVLPQKQSSQSEQCKYSILVNELQRRLEILDRDIELNENCRTVE